MKRIAWAFAVVTFLGAASAGAQPIDPRENNFKLLVDGVQVDGVVRWSRSEPPGSERCATGVEFVEVDEKRRRQLDRVLALELGSNVTIAGHGHVGWVARGTNELASTLFVPIAPLKETFPIHWLLTCRT